MFKRTNINSRVQDAFKSRIRALDRKNFKQNKDYFVGNVLDTSDENPISEHLYKSCFARVSVAVPQVQQDSSIVQTPISISSYLNESKNSPLTFSQGKDENPENRFRGHSGITKISVSQLQYYTQKFTIDWTCPDPVYFEEVFEPSFLKFGAYCAIEFGWGTEDTDFNVSRLTIEEMRRLLEGTNLTDRNLTSGGNYYCGVGTVIRFNWKVNDDGTYSGNMEAISPGASALLETTQGVANASDAIPIQKIKNTVETERLTRELINSKKIDEADKEQILKDFKSSEEVVRDLKVNTILFNLIIENLDDVVDKYVFPKGAKFVDPNDPDSVAITGTNVEGLKTEEYSTPYLFENDNDFRGAKSKVNYYVNKTSDDVTAMRISVIGKNVPDYLKGRHFMSWGWFEDNVLNEFFGLEADGTPLQSVGSFDSKGNNNPCTFTEYLYSMGLDSVILPNKHHPILDKGFDILNQSQNAEQLKEISKKYYDENQRINLSRIYAIYKTIDKEFSDFIPKVQEVEFENTEGFDTSTDEDVDRPLNTGIIRNMVFPVEMYQKHFKSIPSLRQGLRNFWADVTNQYGGYWGFQIGEDTETPGRVGVFDSNFSPKGLNSTTKDSNEDDSNGMWTFSVYSKDSIVKSFDVDLKLTAEAATLARYGTFTRPNSGTSKPDGKKELGLEAWNILNQSKTEEQNETLEDLKRYRKINQKIVKNLKYNREFNPIYNDLDDGFDFKDDLKKKIEIVENERIKFVGGIGIYDKKGNFSQYYKSVMLYLINYADIENSGSNILTTQPLLPVEISLTIDGIGGLQIGNLFKVDYLPETYRKFCYFLTSKVEHSLAKSGWETTITGLMVADLPKFFEKNPSFIKPGLAKYQKLFEENYVDGLDNLLLEVFLDESSSQNFLKDDLEKYENIKEKITENINDFNVVQSNRGTKKLIYDKVTSYQTQLRAAYANLKKLLEIAADESNLKLIEVDFKKEQDRIFKFLGANSEFLDQNYVPDQALLDPNVGVGGGF